MCVKGEDKYDRTCADRSCRKRFIIVHGIADYLYKHKARTSTDYYCSYTCWKRFTDAEWEKANQPKSKSKKTPVITNRGKSR